MIDSGRINRKVAHLVVRTLRFLVLSLAATPWMDCHGQVLLKYQVEDIVSQQGELYFPDSVSRASYIENFLHALRLNGYPSAFIRRKTFVGDTLDVRMEAGQLFSWVLLRQGNLDKRL